MSVSLTMSAAHARRHGPMPVRRLHPVMCCPACRRALWPAQLARLIGDVPVHDEERGRFVGWLAESERGARRPGWRTQVLFDTVAAAVQVAPAAVRQLEVLARRTLEGMWLHGLITRADLEGLLRTETVAVQRRQRTIAEQPYDWASAPKPRRTITEEDYRINGNT